MLANNSQHHSNKLNEPPRQQVACREQQQKQLLLPGGPPVCLRKLNSKIGPNKQANVVGLEQISLSASERSLFALRLSLLTLLFSLLLHPTRSISGQLSSPVVRLAEPALKQSLGGGGSAGSISGGPPLGTRAESSSSFFADIEDLDDSSIRKKIGSKQRATSNNNNNNANADEEDGSDFEQLIARIVDGPQVFSSSHSQLTEGLSGHGSTVAADANNRTTMRFFRHGKTFGSIVYTNRNEKQQRRRLINCHLVDLEKHASDVALFEAKYEIRTVDIGFNEMMSLLESCTNIARFKPLHPSPGLGGGGGGGSSALRPLLVVSRPPPVPLALTQLVKLPAATSKANLGGSYNQQQQQQTMTTTDKRRFRRQSKTLHPSPLTPLAPKQGLLQALAQVSREAHAASNRHLVLGEVTAPPAQRANPNKGGLGKALAEISNYDTTDLLAIWRGILPGTNWCGMGDRATSYNDLGFESDIDICCRAHDFCPVRLSAFSAGYGLFNWSFYTRSHCRCDQNFLNCLEQAQSPLSALVLKFYFNIMKTTCLNDNNTRLDPPATTTTTATAYSTSTTKQQQQRPQQVAGTAAIKQVTRLANVEPDAEQQRALLDQIKAHLAIPASRRSQPLQTKLESKLQQQQQQQQQQ